MPQITRISIFQTTKILTIFSVAGLTIFSVLMFLLTFLIEGGRVYINGSDIFEIILGMVVFTIVSFISIACSCALYNFLAKRLGGIEYEKDTDDIDINVFE